MGMEVAMGRRRLTSGERLGVYDKLGGHCAYCGCEIGLDEMQVDHITPLRKGGADVLPNMFPACRSCNHYKSSLDVEQFRRMIEKMPETLSRDSATYRNATRFGLVEPKPHPVVFYFEKLEETQK